MNATETHPFEARGLGLAPFKLIGREHRAALKLAADNARIAEARKKLPFAYSLGSQPHPTPFRAAQGDSLKEYVAWLLENAGLSGKLRIELAMTQQVEA